MEGIKNMMDDIKINYWEVKGYRGNNDYDGPEDNNFCHVVAIDSRFTTIAAESPRNLFVG